MPARAARKACTAVSTWATDFTPFSCARFTVADTSSGGIVCALSGTLAMASLMWCAPLCSRQSTAATASSGFVTGPEKRWSARLLAGHG